MFDLECSDPQARAHLDRARTPRSDPEAAEREIRMALSCAPGELAVQMGAYLFYFYNHRYADALPHAETILEMAARRLNVPCDFADVRPDDADFSALETAPSIYLQALLAYGYCHLRLNDFEAGRTAIAKVCELDPTDRFHAAAIIEIVETGDGDD